MGTLLLENPFEETLVNLTNTRFAYFHIENDKSPPEFPKTEISGGYFQNTIPSKVRSHFHAVQDASKQLHSSYVQKIEEWLDKKIAAPNENLGRKGDVCPFVRPSLERNGIHIFLSLVVSLRDEERVKEEVRSLLEYIPILSPVDPKLSKFKAALIIFPNLDEASATEMVLKVQRELKTEVVKLGKMIGEFYPGCDEPGLHNSQFRPLDSPVPFLALRDMDLFDLPFLISKPEHLKAYLDHFNIHSRNELNLALKKLRFEKLSQRFSESIDIAFPDK